MIFDRQGHIYNDVVKVEQYTVKHVSPETAYVVQDGAQVNFVRTQKRFWIETKKRYGQRRATQIKDPKTNTWGPVTYSWYSTIFTLFLDDCGNIYSREFNHFTAKDDLLEFKKATINQLSEYQNSALEELLKSI